MADILEKALIGKETFTIEMEKLIDKLDGVGCIKLLGNEAGSGQPYHFPYHLGDLRFDTTDSKIKGTLYTITLDNNKTLTQYPLEIQIPSGGLVNDVKINGTSVVVDKVADIPLVSNSVDGVMSKQDKIKLDAIRELLKGDNTHTGTEQIRIPYFFTFETLENEAKVTAKGVSLKSDDTILWDEHSITIPSATIEKAGVMSKQDKIDLGNKVDKTTSDSQVYCTKKVDGVVTQSTVGYSNSTSSNSLAQRDNAGRVRVGDANLEDAGNTDCATPVSYVKGNYIKLLGNEAGSGEPYHIPYNFRDLKYEDKKIKLNLDTITLDNNKTLTTYPMELELPDFVTRIVTEDSGAKSIIDNQKGQHGAVMQSVFSDTIVSFNTNDEDGEDGILGQIYAKTVSTNSGMRFNIYKDGIYYGKGTSTPKDAAHEIAVKGDIAEVLPAYPSDTSKQYILKISYDTTNNKWIKEWVEYSLI